MTQSIITGLCNAMLHKPIRNEAVCNQAAVKRALEAGILVTSLGLYALAEFSKGRLKKGDALVGETSCQLRTLKIIEMFMKLISAEKGFVMQIHLKALSRELNCILKTFQAAAQNLPEPNDKLNLVDYLTKLAKPISKGTQLSEDDIFLILSFALCLTRDAQNKSKTNHLNLRQFLQAPYSIDGKELEKCVFAAKQDLSLRSVQFLQSEAGKLGGVLQKMAKNSPLIVAGTLHNAPCFYTIETMLESLRRNRSLVIMSVHRPHLNHTVKQVLCAEDGIRFQTIDPATKHQSTAAFVIHGMSESVKPEHELIADLSASPVDICLANAAVHVQYAGKGNEKKLPALFDKTQNGVDLANLLERLDSLLHAVARLDTLPKSSSQKLEDQVKLAIKNNERLHAELSTLLHASDQHIDHLIKQIKEPGKELDKLLETSRKEKLRFLLIQIPAEHRLHRIQLNELITANDYERLDTELNKMLNGYVKQKDELKNLLKAPPQAQLDFLSGLIIQENRMQNVKLDPALMCANPEERRVALLEIVLKEYQMQPKHLRALCTPLTPEEATRDYVRMQNYKRMGLKEGMCRENASLFRILHIYPNTLQLELQDVHAPHEEDE